MLQKIKLKIGDVLTSPFVYNNMVKPRLKNGCVKTALGYINVERQSAYIQSLLFWRVYENSERRLIGKYLHRNNPVIELGASIGMTTLTICKAVGGDIPVFTVEANPVLIPNLKKTKEINKLDKLQVINAAVDYGPGKEVSFVIDDNNLGSQKGTTSGSVTVAGIRLSDIVRSNNIGKYALVSDIEGAELELALCEDDPRVLDGCTQIIIELHDTDYQGKHYTKADIAGLIADKFSMEALYSDNNTWVFEKRKSK